jgi:hypothetical protein
MISNRDLIVTENEMGENNPEPSLGVYDRRRAKGKDIVSLIRQWYAMSPFASKRVLPGAAVPGLARAPFSPQKDAHLRSFRVLLPFRVKKDRSLA